MKVAYWPGCVSRGFTPELHGSMAKVAPLLDIEMVELDRASEQLAAGPHRACGIERVRDPAPVADQPRRGACRGGIRGQVDDRRGGRGVAMRQLDHGGLGPSAAVQPARQRCNP